jgi:anti-sigma factor RsiW
MNDCRRTRDALPALLYGDMPPDETAAVRRHLSACPACRAEEAALQQVRRLLDAPKPPAAQVDLPRLYRDAAALQQRRLRRWRRLACAALAAAAVLLVVFGLKLEVRLEGHQLVLRWGAPPAAPAPVRPVAPAEAAASAADLRTVRELLHLLAADVEERDRRQQQALAWLQGRLENLHGQSLERWTTTERDVRALYTLITAQSIMHNKGE